MFILALQVWLLATFFNYQKKRTSGSTSPTVPVTAASSKKNGIKASRSKSKKSD